MKVKNATIICIELKVFFQEYEIGLNKIYKQSLGVQVHIRG